MPSVVFKTPISSRNRKTTVFNSRRKPFLLPQQKTHGFAKKICSRNRKTMVFELSSVARLTPEGPARGTPSIRAWKSHGLGARYPVPATFPQLPRNSTWWGSSHGATRCHIPRDIQCHRVAYGSYTLRERLGMARVVGWSDSTHAWKDHENHWKTMRTIGRP